MATTLVSILAFFLALATATPKINEVFIQPGGNQCENEEFLEVSIPQGTTAESLQEFAIAIVDSTSILSYMDFKDMKFISDVVNDNRLIVVSNDAKTANLKYLNKALTFSGSSVQCIFLLRRPQPTHLNLLELTRVAGVYRLKKPAPLTNQNKNILKQLATDVLVYQNPISGSDTASWMQLIIPEWRGPVHVLPTGNSEILDRESLSRCDNIHMSGTSFRHAIPTPGGVNRCDNVITYHEYTLRDEFLSLRDQRRQANTEAGAASQRTETQSLVKAEDTVANYMLLIEEAQLASGPLKKFFNENPDRNYYKFIHNTANIQESSIRCELCYQQSKDRERQGITPNIMKEAGLQLNKRPADTMRRINEHQNLPYHQNLARARKTTTSTSSQKRDVYEEIAPREDLQVTADKIALVYLELKVGTSLMSHEKMAEGLSDIGFDVGESLNSRKAAKEIVKFLGQKIHDNLIKRLISSDSVFSIMLDSSTDVGNKHVMLVYIRYIEDGAAVTKVLQLTEAHDSSARGMFNIIEQSIHSQGPEFEEYVKKNCVAMATDGASNMMGRYSSLKTKITEYLMTGSRSGKPFQHYHCANHKLALAYNDVMYSTNPALKFCDILTKHCNNLAGFYSSKSYKRRDELQAQSEIEHEKIKEFQRIQQVRWVPHIQNSYTAVVQNYRTFMNHLTSMTLEREDAFPRGAVIAAQKLHNIFSDTNLLATLHLHMDIIDELTRWAKWLERRDGTVIDLEEWHLDVRSSLENMKTNYNHNLKTFLQSCTCENVPCNSLETFEISSNIVWKGVALANSEGDTKIPKLSTTKNLLLDSFLTSFEERFPAEAISAFSVLLPARLASSTNAQWEKLGVYMTTYHDFQNSISTELIELKNRILRSQLFLNYNRDPPEVFWSNALFETELNWTPASKKVIEIALVQPSSTAQVEAGFSMVSAIKTKYRSRLSTTIVQDTLRLKFNGPITKYLPKYHLALDWISAGHLAADAVKRGRVSLEKLKRSEFIKTMRF